MNNLPRIALVASLLPLTAAGGAVAEQTETLDVHRVVELALERNPALKAIEERRNELEGGVREARAEAFPQIALTSSFSQDRNPSLLNSPDFEEFLDFIPDFKPAINELYRLSVEVSQPLYTAGKVGSAIALSRLATDISEAQIETARLDTAAVAVEAYFRLLEAREGLETIEIQQKTRRESLDVVLARYELGEATELERLQSEAALAELQPTADAARGLVRVAEIQLRAALDLPERVGLVVEPSDERLPRIPDPDSIVDMAIENRPEFEDLRLQLAALAKQEQITRAGGLPQVDMTGRYGHTVRLFDDIDDARFKDWTFAIGVRWEFFDGGRRRGQVSQLESQRQQLEWQITALENQVRQEVEAALTEYETAVSRWRASDVSARAASEASRVAAESYREGVALQADWLNAQEREIEARVSLVQAYYAARIGAAKLARAVGMPADSAWSRPAESGGTDS